jgi:hypothetical protein
MHQKENAAREYQHEWTDEESEIEVQVAHDRVKAAHGR